MKKTPRESLWTWLGIGSLIQQIRKNIVEITRLKSVIVYLHVVKNVRCSYVIFLQILIGFVFFFFSLVLLHVSVLLFFTQPPYTRAWICLVLGCVELVGSSLFLIWVVSSKRWMKESLKWIESLSQDKL